MRPKRAGAPSAPWHPATGTFRAEGAIRGRSARPPDRWQIRASGTVCAAMADRGGAGRAQASHTGPFRHHALPSVLNWMPASRHPSGISIQVWLTRVVKFIS